MKNFELKIYCPCDICIKSDVCSQKEKVQELKKEIENISNKIETNFLQMDLRCDNFYTKNNNSFIKEGVR
jgi:hypothetical protein